MDKTRILTVLSLPVDSVITFTQLDTVLWGQSLHFHAEAKLPSDDVMTFELRFIDCREMRWKIYTHMQDSDVTAFPPTELVNFRIGRDQHRSPANLLTDHFGLSLFYGRLEIITQDKALKVET